MTRAVFAPSHAADLSTAERGHLAPAFNDDGRCRTLQDRSRQRGDDPRQDVNAKSLALIAPEHESQRTRQKKEIPKDAITRQC